MALIEFQSAGDERLANFVLGGGADLEAKTWVCDHDFDVCYVNYTKQNTCICSNVEYLCHIQRSHVLHLLIATHADM